MEYAVLPVHLWDPLQFSQVKLSLSVCLPRWRLGMCQVAQRAPGVKHEMHARHSSCIGFKCQKRCIAASDSSQRCWQPCPVSAHCPPRPLFIFLIQRDLDHIPMQERNLKSRKSCPSAGHHLPNLSNKQGGRAAGPSRYSGQASVDHRRHCFVCDHPEPNWSTGLLKQTGIMNATRSSRSHAEGRISFCFVLHMVVVRQRRSLKHSLQWSICWSTPLLVIDQFYM